MLESIQIKNFAIIDSLQLEFESGLTALTGETGAGKSILLDAIKLVAGDRAESDSIRDGADKAEISVCFSVDDSTPAHDWLLESEMSADGECVIRRVLFANGRSKAFINGYNATLTQLRSLCDLLVDIHGQHEHQSLQKSQIQRQLLDAFIGDSKIIDEVKQKHLLYREVHQRLQQAQSGSQEREQRIDLLGLYCEELKQLGLVEGEFEALQLEYRRHSNAGQLIEKSGKVLQLLYQNEDHSIQSALSQCENELNELVALDAGLKSSHELISGALIQAQEATRELRSYQDGIDLDADRLETLNQRIANIQNLARKHRVEISALPALTTELDEELQNLNSSAFDLETIQKDLDKSRQDYLFSALELSHKREQTAGLLSEKVSGIMQQLGMEGGRFHIEVRQNTAAHEFKATGIDTINYLVAANPGQSPKPLARVASGGELSRISLAIQVVMSESSRIPCLIFDEVDSGIGGGIAEIVGKKLRLLGRERQVFCVTHLPQVASQAHHHYRVEKFRDQNAMTTEVTSLGGNERLEEIARMLGGVTITDQTRAHAREMIANQE
ncbi:MAG: DNA repair protein RecN [Gammaproteobacteria bacterium]|nr:MAG: DNA repair protein RecN [Gammaproteobacteria bacterium]